MLCILIDELRLSRFHQILNYLKSPFLPTLLKLAVLFRCKPKPLHGHCRRNRSRDELRDATIALPFQSLLTTLVFQWLKRSLPNIVLHVQQVLFCLFSQFCRCFGCVEVCSRATMLNNSWYATISPEKPISAGTHTQAQPLCQIEGNFWQIFYHFNWIFFKNIF